MIKKLLNKFFPKKRKKGKRNPFWIQEVSINGRFIRDEFFKAVVQGKKVLHIGCTDWPIFRPNINLHIQLSKVANEIHGMDIDLEGIENLKKFVPQKYFESLDDPSLLTEVYDICLIPETLEHVDNPATFLEKVSRIQADFFYFTAPNAFSHEHIERNFWKGECFVEIVHPDHNYWFSPYTLKNIIQKYSNLAVIEVFLFNNETMIGCLAKKIK